MNYHHVHSLFPLTLPCWGQRHIFGQSHLGLKYRHGCSKAPAAPQEMINLNSPLHLGHEHGPLHHRIATEIHPNGFTEGSANVADPKFSLDPSAEIKGIWVSFGGVAGLFDLFGWVEL